jgi:hypothetical protein
MIVLEGGDEPVEARRLVEPRDRSGVGIARRNALERREARADRLWVELRPQGPKDSPLRLS